MGLSTAGVNQRETWLYRILHLAEKLETNRLFGE